MGNVNGILILRNPRNKDLACVETSALADSGSTCLCIPERIREQLALEALEDRIVALADGTRRQVPYVGPVELHFKNRSCYVGALVMGERVLLGLIPMQDLDLVIIPKTQLLDVNPASPDIPSSIAMRSAGTLI